MIGVYKTILNPSEGIYKEKGSKFLAFAYPVSNIDQVDLHLSELRKKYHDARHHSYGFILGLKDQTFRSNDDGEPTHSAGDPILGQIRAFELTNVLVVVVRYFGGIKLGVGGLVTAYKSASIEALKQAHIKDIYPLCSFEIAFPYELTGELESIFNDFSLEFDSKEFTEHCLFTGKVREEDKETFRSRLASVYGIRFSLQP